jgi:hypothetical protein
VVSTGVRLRWFNVVAVVCVGACAAPPAGSPGPSSSPSTSPTRAVHVNPANIRRLRSAFPPGFEVADVGDSGSPARYWGFGPGWSADPAKCAPLADPVDSNAAAPQGVSGSGPGGIVYAVVASSPSAVPPDPEIVAECARWSMVSGRTTATVELVDAPSIDGAATLAMATSTRTVVEGGTETDSQSYTATAYLGDHVAFVTVVTDPGSPQPQLPPDFAATFLVRTVATLRG